MTKADFIKKLQDDLEIKSVLLQETTLIDNIEEWDSLANMTTLAIIDENFNIDFSISDLNSIKSIADIIKLIGLDKLSE